MESCGFISLKINIPCETSCSAHDNLHKVSLMERSLSMTLEPDVVIFGRSTNARRRWHDLHNVLYFSIASANLRNLVMIWPTQLKITHRCRRSIARETLD